MGRVYRLSWWQQFFHRGWDPKQTETQNLVAFNPEQEPWFCGLLQARMEDQHHFQQENIAFSFFKTILTKIWAWFWTYGAQSSNFPWLRFQCYGGPILAQKYVNSSWLFLQHWCWQTSKSGTFCRCSSWLFEVGDSLCVTSSCFPPSPPRGPATWEDRRSREGYGTPATVDHFFSVLLTFIGKPSWSHLLFPAPGGSLPSSVPCKPFAPSLEYLYTYILFTCSHISVSPQRG